MKPKDFKWRHSRHFEPRAIRLLAVCQQADDFCPAVFHMRIVILLSLFLVIAIAHVAVRSGRVWRNIENPGYSFKDRGFSFKVPNSFEKREVHGIDSFVGEYVGDGIKLTFDYGNGVNNSSDWAIKSEDVDIHGRMARIDTAAPDFKQGLPYSARVFITGDERWSGLSMFASCKSEKEVALAKEIFGTIKFHTGSVETTLAVLMFASIAANIFHWRRHSTGKSFYYPKRGWQRGLFNVWGIATVFAAVLFLAEYLSTIEFLVVSISFGIATQIFYIWSRHLHTRQER